MECLRVTKISFDSKLSLMNHAAMSTHAEIASRRRNLQGQQQRWQLPMVVVLICLVGLIAGLLLTW